MITEKQKPDLPTILAPPLIADDAKWLEINAPDYYTAVESAVRAGKTPQAIYAFYMQQSPNRQPLWLRCKHTAAYLISVAGNGER